MKNEEKVNKIIDAVIYGILAMSSIYLLVSTIRVNDINAVMSIVGLVLFIFSIVALYEFVGVIRKVIYKKRKEI